MQRSTKTVLAVLAALFVLGCLGTGAVLFAFAKFADGLGGDGQWSEDSVPERDLPPIFGVRLPAKPKLFRSRQLGFQDAFYEVAVRLPDGSAQQFLDANKLARGQKMKRDPELEDQLRELDPTLPQLEVTELPLPEALLPDGGAKNLHRSGELLEGPGGETWVHLTAFET